MREHASLFVYSFTLENFITVIDDAPIEIQVGTQKYSGQMVQTRGLEVIVSIERDLGRNIPEARLILNLYFLHEMLRKKMEAVQAGELVVDCSLAERVFAGTASSLRPPPNYPPLEPGMMPNRSQEQAITHSQSTSLTFVWGPPGTGKTAAVARIVEAYIKRGLRVLVVAHANAAVDEVTEDIAHTLKATTFYNEGQILRLGTHQKETLANKYDLVLPENISHRLGASLRTEQLQLNDARTDIEMRLTELSTVSQAIAEQSACEQHQQSYETALVTNINQLVQVQSQLTQQERSVDDLRRKLATAEATGPLKRLFFGLKPARIQQQLDQSTVQQDSTHRQLNELKKRREEIQQQKAEGEIRLSYARLACVQALQHLGVSEFQVQEREKHFIAERTQIATRLSEINKQLDDLQKRILTDARVVCTTLAKTFSAKEFPDTPFDVLILDEASMAPMPYLYWALGHCREAAVIAGDFLQLPPICIADTDMATKWLKRSIYMQTNVHTVREARASALVCLLDTQYRMNPKISAISNRVLAQ